MSIFWSSIRVLSPFFLARSKFADVDAVDVGLKNSPIGPKKHNLTIFLLSPFPTCTKESRIPPPIQMHLLFPLGLFLTGAKSSRLLLV